MSMSCLEFRYQCGIDPRRRDAAYLEHRLSCRACGEHARRMEQFDQTVAAAMQVPVPDRLQERIFLKAAMQPRAQRPRWLAAVATLLIAVSAGSGIWYGASAAPLPHAVISHMMRESDSLVELTNVVSTERLDAVLARTGVHLDGDLGHISYAQLCYFRGRLVTHLVLVGENGPITIMLLPHEHVSHAMPIDEEGYHGTIIPVGEGSIAIVGTKAEPMDAVEKKVSSMVEWQA